LELASLAVQAALATGTFEEQFKKLLPSTPAFVNTFISDYCSRIYLIYFLSATNLLVSTSFKNPIRLEK
jgi:hypothetical protein